MKIQGRIAIVTGASGGIGLAVAKALSQKGATVVLAARSEDKLKKLMREIPNSHTIVTDMRKPEDVKNLIEKTVAKVARIDILVNNAGQGLRAPLEKIDTDAYRDIMELTEQMVAQAAQEALGTTRITFQGQEADLAPPWRRVSMVEAIAEKAGVPAADLESEEAMRRACAAERMHRSAVTASLAAGSR